jgi:GGDEF domain-containing protein
MEAQKEVVRARLEGSDFLIGFETETTVAYSFGCEGAILRTLHIDLRQQTVQYVLAQKRTQTRYRVEQFETLQELAGRLPTTVASFDLKFMLRLANNETAIKAKADRNLTTALEDPWDLANCFVRPDTGKRVGTLLLGPAT